MSKAKYTMFDEKGRTIHKKVLSFWSCHNESPKGLVVSLQSPDGQLPGVEIYLTDKQLKQEGFIRGR